MINVGIKVREIFFPLLPFSNSLDSSVLLSGKNQVKIQVSLIVFCCLFCQLIFMNKFDISFLKCH